MTAESLKLRCLRCTVKCKKCNGVGAPWNNSASPPCDECKGTGKVPFTWLRRTDDAPKCCPACKSRYWNELREKKEENK